MKNWIGIAWEKVTNKLGGMLPFLKGAASEIEIAIANKDKAKILEICDAMDARFHEMDEATVAGRDFTAEVRQAVANDALDMVESGRVALKLQRFVDEMEDVATGVDEDDAPPVENPPDPHDPPTS